MYTHSCVQGPIIWCIAALYSLPGDLVSSPKSHNVQLRSNSDRNTIWETEVDTDGNCDMGVKFADVFGKTLRGETFVASMASDLYRLYRAHNGHKVHGWKVERWRWRKRTSNMLLVTLVSPFILCSCGVELQTLFFGAPSASHPHSCHFWKYPKLDHTYTYFYPFLTILWWCPIAKHQEKVDLLGPCLNSLSLA